jgi:hypothetical protein
MPTGGLFPGFWSNTYDGVRHSSDCRSELRRQSNDSLRPVTAGGLSSSPPPPGGAAGRRAVPAPPSAAQASAYGSAAAQGLAAHRRVREAMRSGAAADLLLARRLQEDEDAELARALEAAIARRCVSSSVHVTPCVCSGSRLSSDRTPLASRS